MDLQAMVTGIPPGYGYLALFLILIVEGVGFPWVPYQPVFLAVALSIKAGGAELLPAVAIASAGNLLGNVMGYWAGYSGGRHLTLRYGHFVGVRARELVAAERWFTRWGGMAAFAARFIGLIRTPTIIAAGVTRMNFKSYTFYSATGGAIWCFLWLYGAMVFSGSLLNLWNSQREWVWVLLAGSVISVFIFFHWRGLGARLYKSA